MDVKNNVKGTRDILPGQAIGFSKIESILAFVASLYAYQEIRIPVLEYSDVFERGVGEGSDIVRKEMYTFLDKGERSVTMRPEFTAGIMRSVIQNKLYATSELPLKLFYHGPAFRYERPQLGRYRQFDQLGVESIGSDNVLNDFEVISMAYNMLKALGLDGVSIKINSLGDNETRTAYRDALKSYFLPHLDNMCVDCKQRYELNPLRILDCKVPEDHALAVNAPKINDYLSEASKERFNKLLSLLKDNNIPYEVDDQLVRGLDYYSEVVFEFAYTSKQGKNYGALGGGGHYSNLMKQLGGPDMPGVGFSFGIDRLYDVLKDDDIIKDNDTSLDIYVMPLGDNVTSYALKVANSLRIKGYTVDYCFDNVKLGNMFKRATKKNAKFALIIGENELNNNKVILKDLEKEEQQEFALDDLYSYLEAVYNQHRCKCKTGGECCSDKDCEK